ncbi:MAG: GGDEF domain-containing protein [Georgfuchsia sp.]
MSGFLHIRWTGWRRWAVWSICLGFIFLLGVLHTATDAKLTFASVALLPVLVIAWIGGRRNGLVVAFLTAATLAAGDFASMTEFSAAWIPWVNALTRLMTYSLVAFLAAQLRLLLEREHEHATQDALTGLHNRRAFLEFGNFEVERSKRYEHPLPVVFLDLDDFKQLNDTKGHAAGDVALRATAEALLATLRSTDFASRLGGDEFAVLLPETGYDAAVEAGCKISVAVNHALRNFPPVTCSIGVAWFGVADRTFLAMLKAADELMYEVKESGKGSLRSRQFSPTDKSDAEMRRASCS